MNGLMGSTLEPGGFALFGLDVQLHVEHVATGTVTPPRFAHLPAQVAM